MNPQRKPKREVDTPYTEFIKTQPCLIGVGCIGQIINHHTKTKGSGGSDREQVPLCGGRHHPEVHTIGRDTFQKKYNINFGEEIKRLNALYERMEGAAPHTKEEGNEL